jgi:ubiquinone/menaquinone biosynthesis C-methylase UbiE
MAAAQDYSVGEHDWHSKSYVDWWLERDREREPERRERLARMLGHAPFATDAEIAVVDIGGGYGIVSEMVLEAFPHARVSLQDYSQLMLEAATRRLAPYAERVRYVVADLTDPAWPERVGGPFDLAVSAIAIHNLRELPAIAAVFRGLARLLKPGGVFLDYDLFFDKIGGLEGHRAMLREAGFARIDRLFQYPPAAALAAYAT